MMTTARAIWMGWLLCMALALGLPSLSLGQFAIRESEGAAKPFDTFAQQNPSEDRIEFIESDSENPEMPNWKMATMGGKQFWTDRQWLYGWRIQRNALTGHFRLLDPSNVRHAWGTQENCQEALFQLGVAEGKRAPTRIAVLVHGLMRTSGSMIGLGKRLESEIGATPILFEYASTRGSIAEHAAAFREWIHSLPVGSDGQGARIDFVAHSMGNIVIRRALREWELGEDPYRVYPRIGRMVMLGPPNQGAMIARRLSKTGIFGVVTGKGGLELGREWDSLAPTLATPRFPFAVIAGNLEANRIQNPLVDGASDFVVRVEEAKLEGMSDFAEVPVLHSFLMDDSEVQQAVARFLETGRLRPTSSQQP